MRRLIFIVFLLCSMLSSALYADDLCTTGLLLFREDFGGNNPSDPAVSREAVSGMSSGYQQIYKLQTNDPGMGMGAGCYLVAKRGYRNSSNTNYSVWHVMDDHTYFGDTTRGYFLEIDGRGSGNDVFYSTVINGLCEGSRLTFSAYVANLTTARQYNAWRYNRSYVHPKLSFVLTHPQTGAELARYNTDTIAHDWSLFSTPSSWKYSANWQLVGMNFTVPEGIDSVRLSIRNNATGSSTGNDFALDDIEIRLCLTPDTILTDTLVCDTTRYIRWREKTFAVADTLHDTIFNSCGLDSVYYLLSVQTEHCKEPLCTSGILLFREDFGGNNPEDPRVSTTPVPSMSYNQLLDDHFGVMRSGSYLVTKSGYCNGDTSLTNLPQNRRSQWHLQDDHTYPNDRTRGYMLEIDGRGDNAAFYRTTIDHLCEGIELTFSAYVANVMTWGQYVGSPGRYSYPRLIFKLTNPGNNTELATYDTGDIPFDSAFINDYKCWKESSKWNLVGMNFVVPVGVEAIQLSIYNNATGYTGNDFAIDDIEIHLCMTPDTIRTDTTICDTISQILWRDSLYQIADTLRDTLLSSCGFDSIYYIMKVDTKICCPDLHYATHDTIVCDTLMPYTWHGLLFDAPGSQTTVEKDERGCDTLQTTWTLNTKTCCPDLHYATHDTIVCDTLLPFTWHGLLFDAPGSQTTVEKDERGCDTLQTTWTLNTKICCPDLRTITLDTTVCDTISQILWRDSLYQIADTLRDTLLSNCGFDSIYYIMKVDTKICCPDLHYATHDTIVCDTLMPYTWHGLLFNKPGSQTILLKDEQGCDSIEIDYTLSTFHCEDFCLEGKLLFREDFGGNDPNDPEVSCSRVEGVLYKNACQTPDNISSGACLVTKRGRGYYERQWLDRADHTYPNDFSRGYYLVVNGDNNRLFYSIDLPGGESGSDFSFSAYVISLHESIYGDEERSDIYRCPSILFDFLNGSTSERITAYYTGDIEFEKSISEFKRWHLIGTKFTLPKDIPYIVLNVYAPLIGRIGNDFGLDDIEFRLCRKTEEQRIDTTVCDTLLPLVWLGRQWTDEGTLTDTLRYTDGGDSVYVQMSLHTQNCCPVSQTVLLDTLVCDTLLPFVWQGIIWQNAGIQEISIPHPKWTQCVDTNYIIHLDTVHCERLYPLIVNKYNWQLLCNNVRVRELFPQQTVAGYQWFKDNTLIPGATEDDYSELNELQGAFQLRLTMDNGQYIWSEILTIQTTSNAAPSRIRIYNQSGWLTYQAEGDTALPPLAKGLYIILIEQNGEQFIEKKLIP